MLLHAEVAVHQLLHEVVGGKVDRREGSDAGESCGQALAQRQRALPARARTTHDRESAFITETTEAHSQGVTRRVTDSAPVVVHNRVVYSRTRCFEQ